MDETVQRAPAGRASGGGTAVRAGRGSVDETVQRAPSAGGSTSQGVATGQEAWQHPESEFRLGTAANLQQIIADQLAGLGLRAEVSLGGGGGVAAHNMQRGVHDLDLSTAEGGTPDAAQRGQALEAAANLFEQRTSTTPTTARGVYGGVEVSVTLAPVESEVKAMSIVQDGWAADPATVDLRLVPGGRLIFDKVMAFAARKDDDGTQVEKRSRDASDIASLLVADRIEEQAGAVRAALAQDTKGKNSLNRVKPDWDRLKKVPVTEAADDNRMSGHPLLTGDVRSRLDTFFGLIDRLNKEAKPKKEGGPKPPSAKQQRRQARLQNPGESSTAPTE
ncbi:hypothetical protein [Actinoplanes sp. RD1]|uniref:hypothetical protein n=1 Tax=Actinoplanes sp. RD1 TaxID=3064538 RepID=UPI002740FC91|nr:hypothetical protein [Actinoplanes sp. RD1]